MLADITPGLTTVCNILLILRCTLVAQQDGSVGKALATKADDLNSIPRIEGENGLPSEGCHLMVGHMATLTHTYTHTMCAG